MASSKDKPAIDVEPMEIGVTICSVCGGSEEEDLVLLCDGEGCTNEIHMYCLKPIVTAVPDGDWYCPACDADGSTLHLENMLRSHSVQFQSECLKSEDDYQQYLTLLQQRHHPAEDWRPNILDNRVYSEFDASSCMLVGMPLRIFSEVDEQEHTGRIISSRHDQTLNRWSHLVQFKRYIVGKCVQCVMDVFLSFIFDCISQANVLITMCWYISNCFQLLFDTMNDSGADGRNRSLISWLSIEEHSCCLGGAVVWVKIHGFPWWPAQQYHRSGIEMIRKKASVGLTHALQQGASQVGITSPTVTAVHSTPLAKTNKATSLLLPSASATKIQLQQSSVYLYSFLNDTYYVLSSEEAKTSVLPFLKRIKEVRYGTGKRLSAAYALAALELEIQRSAASAYKLLSNEHLEKFGGLGNVLEDFL